MFYLRVGLSLLGFVGASIYAIALAVTRKDRSRVAYDYAMAMARLLRTSPRKLNLVAQLIRGRKANEALNQLTFSRRGIARVGRRTASHPRPGRLAVGHASPGLAGHDIRGDMVQHRHRPRRQGGPAGQALA